ncbi:MAG TPA: MFS transporter [Agriterribacter sp.]|nr:MFS transporter [Agriterribacter sp.]
MEKTATLNNTIDGMRINKIQVNQSNKSNTELKTERPLWSAIFSMTLGVTGLILAELLPISLLTPMAHDLGISEGAAGQTVTATAFVALIFSLFSAVLTRHFNRKIVIITFSILLTISCLMVGLAPNLFLLLIGRLILGIAIGGFWSMATAIAMRLVPDEFVPKALSIIFGAIAVSTAIFAPIGTYLGAVIGWRATFLAAAGIGVIALIWQVIVMPSLPPREESKLQTLLVVLKRPLFGIGMIAVLLVFGGQQSFITYMRPILENVTHLDVNSIALVLLAFGVTSFIGTSLAGHLLKKYLKSFLMLAPFLLSLFAVGLMFFGSEEIPATIFIAAWGMVSGTVAVAWSTWVARKVSDEAETAGGLLVASIQLGLAVGAGVGGFLFDKGGSGLLFLGSAVMLLIASIIIKTKISSGNTITRNSNKAIYVG